MTRKYLNYNEQDVLEAVKTSFSIADVLRKLDLRPTGGNYANIKRKISKLDYDISHFTGQGWNKENYRNQNYICKKAFKDYLIRERGHKCQDCNLTEWKTKPIPLELEHIDGNSHNHKEENCLLLCPNCHSFTPTWRRRKD